LLFLALRSRSEVPPGTDEGQSRAGALSATSDEARQPIRVDAGRPRETDPSELRDLDAQGRAKSPEGALDRDP
jgi:hypothetical protein